MSMLRNVLTYMGLGPDEDYDDGYLYDAGNGARSDEVSVDRDPSAAAVTARKGGMARKGDTRRGDTARRGDPHAPRERPDWLGGPSSESAAKGSAGGDSSLVANRAAETGNGSDRAVTSETESRIATRRQISSDDDNDLAGEAGPKSSERPARTGSGLRAELRSRAAAARPLRAVPPAVVAQPDLVQPETGITVRSVPATTEAEMGSESSVEEKAPPATRQVKPRALSPQSFGDAKILADEFKRSVPVIMNLQGIERDLARRLIDFASGICYALDGGMEKIAAQVFLLTPQSVEVSDEDRRRIEQRGYDR